MSNYLSVHIEKIGPYWKDLHEILYLMIFSKYIEKLYAILKMTTDTLYEILSTFFYISLILRRLRNVSDKGFSENQSTFCGASSLLCWFNNKEFSVLYLQSNTTIFP